MKKSTLKFIWWSVCGFTVLPSVIGLSIYWIVQEVNAYYFSILNLIVLSILLFIVLVGFCVFVPLWIKNYKKYKKDPDSFE